MKETFNGLEHDGLQYGGAMDGIKESDRILGRNITVDELPKAPSRFEKKQREINQNAISPNICTIVSAFGCVADVTGYTPTVEDIMEVRRRGLNHPTHPFDPSIGWYVHLAVDEVRNYCSELGIKLSTISFPIGSDEHEHALDKGYTVATGHTANATYNRDRQDNGIIEDGGVRERITYGHANGQFRYEGDQRRMKRDSYKGRKFNIYELKVQKEMLKAGRQFKRGFIFFPQYIMETQALPVHTGRHEVTGDSHDIVIAREVELAKAITEGHTPIYTNYTGEHAITRMLIELQVIRSKQ